MNPAPGPASPVVPNHPNPRVPEWLEHAAQDFRTAEREFAVADHPSHGIVCFHAQQAVEKLMKAVLVARAGVPPRTHDLLYLERLVEDLAPGWSWPLTELGNLTLGAVEYRYPGRAAARADAAAALDSCRRLWPALCSLL